jgi:hypothetical protein
MNSVTIIDDVISKEYQDYLESLLLNNSDMAWHLIKDVRQETLTEKEYSVPGMSIQAITDGEEHGVLSLVFKSLAYTIAEKLDIKIKTILNARTFLQFPGGNLNDFIDKEYHVDTPRAHRVLLYYVNESDGNTIILKQRYPFAYNKISGLTTGDVLQEIPPKKGRVVMFDGAQFHSSSISTKNLRCVINLDVVLADFTNKLN